MNIYRNIQVDSFRICAVEEISEAWVRSLIKQQVFSQEEKTNIIQLPQNFSAKKAFVKIYKVRKKRKVFLRLKKSRAIREGEGYRYFNKLGIITIKLLMYGEERKCGLFHKGVLVTVYKHADTIADAYLNKKDFQLLLDTVKVLALIHKSGVAHGDPRTRNFLATAQGPLPFDLPSWSKLTTSSQMKDLVRFLGSSAVLLGKAKKSYKLLETYRSLIPDLPATEKVILYAAEKYCIEKGEA